MFYLFWGLLKSYYIFQHGIHIQVGGWPARSGTWFCAGILKIDKWGYWRMISPSYSSWKRSGCPGNDVVSTRVFSQQMPVSIGSAHHRTLNCFNWFQVCELCDCQCRMDASHCNLVSPILTEQTRQKYWEVKWHTLKSLNCCKVKGTCSFDHPQVNFGSTSISCGWSDCPVILAHFWCGSGKSTSPFLFAIEFPNPRFLGQFM